MDGWHGIVWIYFRSESWVQLTKKTSLSHNKESAKALSWLTFIHSNSQTGLFSLLLDTIVNSSKMLQEFLNHLSTRGGSHYCNYDACDIVWRNREKNQRQSQLDEDRRGTWQIFSISFHQEHNLMLLLTLKSFLTLKNVQSVIKEYLIIFQGRRPCNWIKLNFILSKLIV